ncbi:MAG: TIGR02206 family membrane protein [Oscillospiraceae bacterium]|nr:TIGR02206 family membrane protein [Oscillospiraceae bacterium]
MQQLILCAAYSIIVYGLRRRQWNARLVLRGVSMWLAALAALQIALVPLQGASVLRNALPFHLCSFTVMLTIPMLWARHERLFQFCWFLGMPAALTALIFPAVGYSPWPTLARWLFLTIHATITFAPLMMYASGSRPRREGVWTTLLIGNAMMLGALIMNQAFGANYMFLSSAPDGTPLTYLATNGKAGYLAALECVALLLTRALSRLTVRSNVMIHHKRINP